jgi:ABC-type uncharacterized transport system substrate-binding protein
MRRREFTLWLGGAIAALPRIASAQPGKLWRLGILVIGSADIDPLIKALQESLARLGYIEGRNVEFEFRSAEGSTSRLPSLASELVNLKVDLIVAFQTPAVTAAKRATADIPIVMGASGDPVGTGLVASLARPGGNVTGMTGASAEIGGKNLELVREVIPTAHLVGVLANVPDPFHKPFLEALQSSGRTLGVEIKPILVKGPEQLDDAFAEMKNAGVAALIVQPSLPHRRLIDLALKHRLPSFAPNADFAVAGGLMAYSADQLELAREAATFVDKILKGRKPADLPVQLATKFQLVINLKTATALGLTLSPTLLTRADQVIE